MENWLVRRLTPKKQTQERWADLARAFEACWESFFDPRLGRFEALRSYFSSHPDDLALKLREIGDYFTADMPRLEDRPIAVAWRKLELEYKDLELALASALRRHFYNLPVTWLPLFAPVDQPYGFLFQAADPWLPDADKNLPPAGFFLTSRGVLGVDAGHLLSVGLARHEFLERADSLVRRIKPLHIVYDGYLWYIRFDLPFFACADVCWERSAVPLLPFVTTANADLLSLRREREGTIYFFLIPPWEAPWRLDVFMPEGHPPAWMLPEYALPGVEGMPLSPFTLYLVKTAQAFPLPLGQTGIAFQPFPERFFSADFPALATRVCREENEDFSLCGFSGAEAWPVRCPLFDEVPADFCPVDMPVVCAGASA